MDNVFKIKYGIKLNVPDDILYEIYQFSKEPPCNKNVLNEMTIQFNTKLVNNIKMDNIWRDWIISTNPSLEDLVDSCRNRHYDNEKKLRMLMIPLGPRMRIRNQLHKLGLLEVM
tara:strand:- start:365 stop:706 length:342 start_codon:yes stop_codon:yes gene_type:complete